ncbi:MAG: tetratricopeptide repeat protein [Aureispira sp.]|nr:tetratricopeptide repeat protein [Aureispira sp.]
MKISKVLFPFLFWIFLSNQSIVFAQKNTLFEKATQLVAQTQYSEAIQTINQFLDTNSIDPIQNKIEAYNLLGRFYGPTKFNKIDSSLHYFKKSLELAEQHANDEAIAKNSQDLGILYFRLQEYEKSLPFLKHSIQIYTDFQDHKNAARGISILSYVYLKKRNYHKALLYQQQSIKTLEQYLPKDHYFITDAKHNLGAIHSKLQNHREAIDYILTTYEIYKKGDHKDFTNQIALDLGFLYQTFNKHDSALYYAQIVLDQCSLEDHYNLTWVYSIKHEVAAKEKDFDNALKYGTTTIYHALQEFGPRSPEVAYSYFYISNIYKEQSQWDTALSYIQKALIANHQTFADSSLSKNPLLTGAFSTEYQLLFLEYKAECLHQLYKEVQNKDALRESENVFLTAISMIDSLRQEYQVPQNLLIQRELRIRTRNKRLICKVL